MTWPRSDPTISLCLESLFFNRREKERKRERERRKEERRNLGVLFAKAPNALIKQIKGPIRVSFLQVKESRVPPVVGVPFVCPLSDQISSSLVVVF